MNPTLTTRGHVLQIQLDFATMQRENPKLLTLKDFVMSSNQTPESPSDVLSLLQAFAQFKQGTLTMLANTQLASIQLATRSQHDMPRPGQVAYEHSA